MLDTKRELADRGRTNGLKVDDNPKALRREENDADGVIREKHKRKSSGIVGSGSVGTEVGGNKPVNCRDGKIRRDDTGPMVDTQSFEKIIIELND